MKALFVGQRVKVVRVSQPKYFHKLGICGRITEIKSDNVVTIYGLDCDPIEACEIDGEKWEVGWMADQLEPILPEGSAPSEYSFSELMDSLRETVK